jgi:hypothetical protein
VLRSADPSSGLVKVHVFQSHDGEKTTAAHTLLEARNQHTLKDLLEMLEHDRGILMENHSLCILPRRVFTGEDVEALLERLMMTTTAQLADDTTALYVGHEDSHTTVRPIHGFIPLVKSAETQNLRRQMKQQESLLHHSPRQAVLDRAVVRDLILLEQAAIREDLTNVSMRYEHLRAVVYDLRTSYRKIYSSVHDLIRSTEMDALLRLEDIVKRTGAGSAEAPMQSTDDLCTLLENGAAVKDKYYDAFMKEVAARAGTDVAFCEASIKGIWRCVEKMTMREEARSCKPICDVVRGALCCDNVDGLASALQIMVESPLVRILRIKNRLREANDSGWADCLVNFTFVNDRTEHVCEVQLVHENLMLVRKNMGAHASYSFFRSAAEMLETERHWREECALADLFNSTNGPRWVSYDNWCTKARLETWFGVTVNKDHGFVEHLQLTTNNLQGIKPSKQYAWSNNDARMWVMRVNNSNAFSLTC